MSYRISVDTGGTFTDLVVSKPGGEIYLGKAPTNRERVFVGVSAALDMVGEQLGEDGLSLLAETELFTYATTRATNSILEGTTAKTAFLTTDGFPDTLVLREGGKFGGFDFRTPFPEPYIPRRRTFEIRERIDSEGEIVRPLDEDQARGILRGLRERDFEAVCICLLWSPVNGEHEQLLGRLVEEELPGIPYTLSHTLNPILREYRRASATAIDASLKPLMQQHLRALSQDLSAAGFSGDLLAATSSGGVMRFEDLAEQPIYSVRSGPSLAPVAGYTQASAENVAADVIVCDTGGTSFDVSVVRDGRVKHTRETWLGGRFTGHLTGLSSVDARSIGAGGGSIAWIDPGGLLRIGPASAGADPGPACYGRGGDRPTVTDAAAVLGYLNPEFFLGGRMPLNVEAARTVIGRLGAELDRSLHETAAGILAVANEHMVGAIQEITINEGIDPRECLIVAGGGAAGLNIVPIARELGCPRVLVPRTAGALSAVGAQHSDVVRDVRASLYARSDRFDHAAVNEQLRALEEQFDDLEHDLRALGIDEFHRTFGCEARYLNQVWELMVPLPGARIDDDSALEQVIDAFHSEHERVFSVRDPASPVEFLLWNARLTATLGRPALRLSAKAQQSDDRSTRTMFFGDAGEVDALVVDGPSAIAGTVIDGPAVIEEPTTTIVVYPDSRVTVTDHANYMIEVS